MDYEAVLAQVLALLQREKRLSYRVRKRRLGVDPVNALVPIPVKGRASHR